MAKMTENQTICTMVAFSLLMAILIIPSYASGLENGENELEDDGGFHVPLLTFAAFLGLISLLTGMRNSRIKFISKWFPKFVPRVIHRWISVLYYLVYFGTFIVWSMSFYSNRGSIYFTLHGQLGLFSFILAIIGIISGVIMWKRPARLWRLHWIFNPVSYVLLLVTIVLGKVLGD